jgi:hypothetical protein
LAVAAISVAVAISVVVAISAVCAVAGRILAAVVGTSAPGPG